jgi:hypothetical protein
VYLALASAALRANPFADLGELAEDVKRRCVTLKMSYTAHQIDKAIGLLSGTDRLRTRPIPKTQTEVQAAQGRPLNDREARETLKRLGLDALIRRMPQTPPSTIEIDAPVERERVEHDRY